jgi:molybdopterin/thiamine biosynthesis adenylyltransferase
MNPEAIKLDMEEETEDRYSRFRLIPWWDQEKISSARVVVVGAGALGNEILKNLALLGFLHVVVVDLDRVELSNLSRSILFRPADIGSYKAEAAARAYVELVPGAEVRPVVGNVMQDCGLGLFAWADVILAGLDNRESRLWINRAAWKVGRPWFDGAIEGLNGVCRVFLPGKAPCYECTLGEADWAILQRRMSCNLLLHEPKPQGRVPTTPTISSIIAGIEVQEAVKYLHDLPTLAGKGYVFEGTGHTSYVVEYTENPECLSHYSLANRTDLGESSNEMTLRQLHDRARCDLAADDVTLEFSRDIVHKLVCPVCQEEEKVFAPVGSLFYENGYCPRDGQMRVVHTLAGYSGEENLAALRLDQLGLPSWDMFTARGPAGEMSYLLAGDAPMIPESPLVSDGPLVPESMAFAEAAI